MAASASLEASRSQAAEKSIFDRQRVGSPRVYTSCGRASFCVGAVCIAAELSVFIVKRGVPASGVGIWTGAPFVILGAVTLAVPKTRTVCSVSTCGAVCAAAALVCLLGTAASCLQIARTNDILQHNATPRPNFELVCPACAKYIVAKEAVHIVLLLLQLVVCCRLLMQVFRDCLCCFETETEVVASFDQPAAPANHSAASVSGAWVTANQGAAWAPPPPAGANQSAAGANQSAAGANQSAARTPVANHSAAWTPTPGSRPLVSPSMRRSQSAARVGAGASLHRAAGPMLFEL